MNTASEVMGLVQRARAAEKRLLEHGVPVVVKVVDITHGGQRTLEVEVTLGAVANTLLLELLAERIEQERGALKAAEQQIGLLKTDTLRPA